MARLRYKLESIPFSTFNQNCFNWLSNGVSVSISNLVVRLQNCGPIEPNFVGQMPWMVQISFCDGNMQTLLAPSSIHCTQAVIGQRCVKISTSKSASVLSSSIGELILNSWQIRENNNNNIANQCTLIKIGMDFVCKSLLMDGWYDCTIVRTKVFRWVRP